ncbi:signal peptidase II [Neolewinella antarctica]|uniref:Lipoprotein signal peptidase n=1 Tax=Neolewinella antarctica TaxID=442734 RepID=A0ABX0X807_9BACT|nr:signal peptidase II [Neolewinella antarctica]NJC24962.1 signal peptidase II [Neolewinella antarctica]
MTKFKARIVPVAIAIVVTVLLDQWTKQLAIEHLLGQPDHLFFGELFRLTFVRNTGAFLSLGSDLGPIFRTLLLEVFPAALLVALLYYIFKERHLNKWQVVALALIVGGGLSNIVDRLLFGHVVDMLHMKAFGLQTGIFNVADMAIMAGMFIMLPFAFRDEPVAEPGAEEAKG